MNFVDVVTVDITTHGGSHIYGLPYLSPDSLDPMDHFCTCCNLTDHIRLPIIHTKIYRNINRYKRQEQIECTDYNIPDSSYKAKN